LIIGLLLTPFILYICKSTDYGKEDDVDNPYVLYKDDDAFVFMGKYFKLSFNCIFSVNNEEHPGCNYSFLYLIGYVTALFVL